MERAARFIHGARAPAPMPATPFDALFRPRTVAVIGASRKPGSVGRQIFDNLLAGGFEGAVFPVNPSSSHVGGVKAYASVLDVPDAVDLAIVVVPAERALDVVEECGRKGVKGLVIITAGFREIGGEGAKREERLAALLAKHGMRAIGPNCMGIANLADDVRLNATFSPTRVKSGGIAFVSQSGALGMAILEVAADLDLGLSYFVSLGNKTNVSTNDLLALWERDPSVTHVLLYLENFGNPRKFVELARRVGAKKPILAVKSGRTPAGARAARSHTGALAERDVFAEALFEQCGVIRARTIRELFDYARIFARAPLPRGPRVGVVTNSGGPGIMATDALGEYGLALADLSPATIATLRAKLLPEASASNPVDVIAGGGAESVRAAITALAQDDGVDILLVIYTPPVFVDEDAIVRAIVESERRGKPLVACVLGREGGGGAFRKLTLANVPTFTFPEGAVRATSALWRYAERQRRPASAVPAFPDARRDDARAILRRAVASGAEWLSQDDALAVLAAYGIPVVRSRVARSAADAERAARELGGRVALKAVAPNLVHKSEAGGLALAVPAERAAAEFEAMRARVAARGFAMEAAIVQEMAPKGREVVLGMSADPKFGPLLMFGLGGVYVEVLKDVVFRLAPLTEDDARRMVRAIRAWPLLEGVRGEAGADVPAIEDALLRLSALVADAPEIAEIDVNPFLAGGAGEGGRAVDARIRLWPRGEPPRAAGVVPELATRG